MRLDGADQHPLVEGLRITGNFADWRACASGA
jgi:hypothetical protein